MREIGVRYHALIKEWHPDVSQTDPRVAHEMTIRLKEAYDLLVEYCMNRSFSFRMKDLVTDLGQTPSDYWKDRFDDDPIRG